MNKKLLRLVESAVLIGLATVLSLVKIFQMPLGGSVTLCSMLPILLIAYKYRFKWGVLCAFLYSLIQFFLDLGELASWGLTPTTFVGSMFFDYFIAFTCLSLAGLYGKGLGKYVLGMVTAVGARLVSHIISGVIFFGTMVPKDWAKPFVDAVWHTQASQKSALAFFNNPLPYSIIYNAGFLLPDFAICLFVGIAVYRPLRKYLAD